MNVTTSIIICIVAAVAWLLFTLAERYVAKKRKEEYERENGNGRRNDSNGSYGNHY